MPKYVFQDVLNELPGCYRDAMMLDLAVEKALQNLTAERREINGRGNGRPPKFHQSLNRAVVLAAAAGMEAYFEKLATAGRDRYPTLPSKDWYVISGLHGAIQTPSPQNIRKLYWSLFHFDPAVHWKISVTTSESERGGNGSWRQERATVHEGEDAINFFNHLVNVRHELAHADPTKRIPATPGIVAAKKVVHSHHAYNAVSAALQISLQTTSALARHLGIEAGGPRWQKSWNAVSSEVGMGYWLAGTPAFANEDWKGFAPTVSLVAEEAHIAEDPGIPSMMSGER